MAGTPVSRGYSQNMQHYLWERESGFNRHNLRHQPSALNFMYEREFYKSVTPKLTIQNVDKPLGYIRKFTPDGKYLLGFSQDQRALEVYTYRGVGSAAELLQRIGGECITAADHSKESLRVRQLIYERLFKLRWRTDLVESVSPRCHLNREFSVFLEDGNFVLVAGVGMSFDEPPYEHYLMYPDLYDDCDIHDTRFFLVDMRNGKVSDELEFKQDWIILSHNNGVSVHGNTIAMLSKYRQCIELVELVNGKLLRVFAIGPFGCSLDQDRFNMFLTNHEAGILPLSHLKQRLLAFLYGKILDLNTPEQRQEALRRFYRNFKTYEDMVMNKVQLIDADHLLIRYEERANQSLLPRVVNDSDFQLYIFYSIIDQSIVKVFEKDSVELLLLIRDYCDTFRNVRSLQTQRCSSSPSNNLYHREAFDHAINSMSGGLSEAASTINPTVPISTQSFTSSPYLDCNLFSYDDSFVSALERPKASRVDPIQFCERQTNIPKFRLYLEAPTEDGNDGAATELVAFIFHPFDPFIISIQRLSTRYVINFHIYNGATTVQE